jgi:hypothetical protein
MDGTKPLTLKHSTVHSMPRDRSAGRFLKRRTALADVSPAPERAGTHGVRGLSLLLWLPHQWPSTWNCNCVRAGSLRSGETAKHRLPTILTAARGTLVALKHYTVAKEEPWCGILGLSLRRVRLASLRGLSRGLFFSNPEKSSQGFEAPQSLRADPELGLISERSPYMRTER